MKWIVGANCKAYTMAENRHVSDVWRLATREAADFQKQWADIQLTARLFAHSAEKVCLAPREQQSKHARQAENEDF